MTRLCSIRMYIVCLCCFMCFGIAYGQDAFIDSGGATIKGQVRDASPERQPIEGVTVKIVDSADGQEYTVTTDKDGNYEKTGLQAGRYTISVSKDGYADRMGKSKVVAVGGEVYDSIIMRKKDNVFTIFTLFQRQSLVWLLVAGVTFVIIVALVIFFINLRKPRY